MSDLRAFVFSQTSLRSYQTCPRQFKLRYIDHLKWPAEMGSPQILYEKYIRDGKLFHRMVEQFFLGLTPKAIERQIDPIKDAAVAEHWRHFKAYSDGRFDLKNPKKTYMPEHTIRAKFASFTVEAKFDLLIFDKTEQTLTIYDWKTAKLSRQSAFSAENGLQSKVYLAAAKQYLDLISTTSKSDPNMIYWFAGSGGSTVQVRPTPSEVSNFEAEVAILIDKIITDEVFELTEDVERCGVCPFRSFCGTVLTPTQITEENVMDMEEPFPWDLDISSDSEF